MKYCTWLPTLGASGVLLFATAACSSRTTESAAPGYLARRISASTVGLAIPTMPDTAAYRLAPPRDPNGIGKYYLGRQIAHVMGHEGANWLDRSSRAEEEGTDQLLNALHLKPTDVVADIGAGTGYFSFQLARRVPRGLVLAVDIQPEMLAELQQNKVRLKLPNVRPVLGQAYNPHLPADSLDVVLIVDAYHEFDHPREMAQAIRRALRPGVGRLALAEYRTEDPQVPIKAIHKMSVEQVRKEMQAVGLDFVEAIEALPQQHLLIFRKK